MDHSPPSRRDLMLDVWRGLACVLVVVDHSAVCLHQAGQNLSGLGGWDAAGRSVLLTLTDLQLGPPLFFVLSGYVIALSLESIRRKGSSPWSFLVKRLWRTFPPYWVAVAVFLGTILTFDLLGQSQLADNGFALGLPRPETLTLEQWIGNLTLTETWRPLVSNQEAIVFTRIAWSLCYQEQFYLVAFLVLAAMRGDRFRPALLIVSGLIMAYRVMVWDSGALHRIDGAFPVLWHQFAVGLGVHWRLKIAGTDRRRWAVDGVLAGLMLIGAWTGDASTAVAAGFGLVLIATHRFNAAIGGHWSLAPLRACGARCYSLYLIHLPAVVVVCGVLGTWGVTSFWAEALVMVPAAFVASLAAGWCFYAGVECRFRELPGWSRKLRTASAPAFQPLLTAPSLTSAV